MPETQFPTPEGIFCLRCRYELRGLTSRRCPECGRVFDPERAETYSRFASRQTELQHAIRSALPRRQTEIDPLILANSTIPRLWEQIAHLVSENIDLRAMINALGQALIEKGILENNELRHRLERLDLFEPRLETITDEEVVDALRDNTVPGTDQEPQKP
jgi:hypothetical protein